MSSNCVEATANLWKQTFQTLLDQPSEETFQERLHVAVLNWTKWNKISVIQNVRGSRGWRQQPALSCPVLWRHERMQNPSRLLWCLRLPQASSKNMSAGMFGGTIKPTSTAKKKKITSACAT